MGWAQVAKPSHRAVRVIVRAAVAPAKDGVSLMGIAAAGRRDRPRLLMASAASGGAATEAEEAVVAPRHCEVAKARAAQRRRRGERSAAKDPRLAEGRLRIVAPRPGDEAGIWPERARSPLPDVAEVEAARRALVRRRFPLGFARQAAAGPATPGFGLVAADVHRRLGLRHAGEPAMHV